MLNTYRVNINNLVVQYLVVLIWSMVVHDDICITLISFLVLFCSLNNEVFTTFLGWTLNGWKAAVLESANMCPALCLFLLTRNKVPLSFHPIHTSATHERESVKRTFFVVSLFLLQREYLNIAVCPVQIYPRLQGNPAAGSQEHL